MRGRYFLQIAYRSCHHETALIGILIIATAPSATSAITVILITLYIVSCWRLYTVLSSSDFTLLHLFLSLMESCISCLLTRFVHRWTAIFNLSLILCFYTLTPIRYMLYHRYKEVIQWICLFVTAVAYESWLTMTLLCHSFLSSYVKLPTFLSCNSCILLSDLLRCSATFSLIIQYRGYSKVFCTQLESLPFIIWLPLFSDTPVYIYQNW